MHYILLERAQKVIFCRTLWCTTTCAPRTSNSKMRSHATKKIHTGRTTVENRSTLTYNHIRMKRRASENEKETERKAFLLIPDSLFFFFFFAQNKFIWVFDIEQCDKQCIDCTAFASFVIITIMTINGVLPPPPPPLCSALPVRWMLTGGHATRWTECESFSISTRITHKATTTTMNEIEEPANGKEKEYRTYWVQLAIAIDNMNLRDSTANIWSRSRNQLCNAFPSKWSSSKSISVSLCKLCFSHHLTLTSRIDDHDDEMLDWHPFQRIEM